MSLSPPHRRTAASTPGPERIQDDIPTFSTYQHNRPFCSNHASPSPHERQQRYRVHHIYFSQLPSPKSPTFTKTFPGCEEVMQILDECHAQGFLFKITGGCNEAKQDVNKCLRAERLERQARNREKAKQMRERIQEVWNEIDDNS